MCGMLRGMCTCVLHGPLAALPCAWHVAWALLFLLSDDTTVVEKTGLEETLISMVEPRDEVPLLACT